MQHPVLRSMTLIACLLGLVSAAWSQEIRGTVSDPSGAVIREAAVQLLTSDEQIAQTRTNSRGQFNFQLDQRGVKAGRSPDGVYTIVVFADGFASYRRAVQISSTVEVQMSIVLEIAAGRQMVDVDGTIPLFKDQLDINEVRLSPAKDLGEALSALDGVWKIRKGGIANDVVIRGFQQNNINMLVDGSRTYGACPGHMDPAAQHVDFSEVERVEVTKGAFDVMNQGSLGALVNVVTKTPGEGLRFAPSTSVGSFGYYNPNATASYGSALFRILGGYSYRTAEPYQDGSGRPFTDYANYSASGRQQRSFNINTGWVETEFSPARKQQLHLAYTRQQAGLILYPYLTMDADYDNADRAILKYRLRALSNRWQEIRVESYFTQVHHFMSNEFRSSAMNGAWTMASNASTRAVGGRMEADLGPDFTFGVESYYRNWNVLGYMNMGMMTKINRTVPNVDTQTIGSFLSYRHAFGDRLHLIGGLRFDHADTQVTASNFNTDNYYQFQNTRRTSSNDNYPSGNLRLSLALPQSLELFAGVGTTGRIPDAEERYISRGMGSAVTVGDPLLPITRDTEVTLGINVKHGRSYLRPTLFYSTLSNYIIVNEQPALNMMAGMGSMATSGMGTPSTARSYTNVDARIYGGELTYGLALTEALSLSGGGSYSRGAANRKSTANVMSSNLPEMPPLRTWAALRYVYKWTFAEVGGSATSRQSLVDADLKETPTAGYGVLNLKLGFTRRKLACSFSVDNLLGHFYYEDLSYYRDPYASGVKVPEPGRNLFVQVKYMF